MSSLLPGILRTPILLKQSGHSCHLPALYYRTLHQSYQVRRRTDQARAIELGENALLFAQKILKPGGNFVVKSFQGQDFNTLIRLVREHFLSARTFRPHSTRKGSTEIYIVAKNFIGREWNNETLKYCTNETKGPV